VCLTSRRWSRSYSSDRVDATRNSRLRCDPVPIPKKEKVFLYSSADAFGLR
jgi:hypothetical protein